MSLYTFHVSAAQHQFLQSPFPKLMAGGVGSGKTTAGVFQALLMPRDTVGCIVAPTYTMARDVILPALRRTGLIIKENLSSFDIHLRGKRCILIRSATNADRLRGLNLDWFWLDEAVYCPLEAYEVLLARLRQNPFQYWLTTTPRRESWVYERIVSNKATPVSIIHAPTPSNPFLSPSYTNHLIRQYGSMLARREIAAEWVSLVGTLIRQDWLRYGDMLRAGETAVRIISVDLAIGRKQSNDYTAIIVLSYDPQRRLYQVDDALQGRWSFSEQVATIHALYDQYTPRVVLIESNQYQRALAEHLASQGVRVKPIIAKQKKEERISLLAPLYELGLITHARRFIELEAQLLGYPDVTHDDLLDALTQAVQYAQSIVPYSALQLPALRREHF